MGNGIEINLVLPKQPEETSITNKFIIPSIKELGPPRMDINIDQYGLVLSTVYTCTCM